MRRLSDGAFHSGQDLACEFGLSRASVFNILGQAEKMGLCIHAVPGRGYRLPGRIDWLDCADILKQLGDEAGRFDVRVLDSVDSTNSALMKAALEGAPNGTVIAAEHQFAGRGRRGRTWHATPGGSLTFSVLWRFDGGLQAIAGLSLAVGLAIARVVNRRSAHAAQLKWPNDLIVGYRKLAGVLIEVQGDLDGPSFAVVGVGLNVRLRDAQREGIDQAVIDLDEMGVAIDRNQLLADSLREMRVVVDAFGRQGFAAVRDDWCALDAYAGRPVSLELPGSPSVHGVAAGVDDNGAFLLRGADGALHAYHGGEISLRLKAAR